MRNTYSQANIIDHQVKYQNTKNKWRSNSAQFIVFYEARQPFIVVTPVLQHKMTGFTAMNINLILGGK